jgi:hypothetical protein
MGVFARLTAPVSTGRRDGPARCERRAGTTVHPDRVRPCNGGSTEPTGHLVERNYDMAGFVTIYPRGDHEYLVRLSGGGEVVESWFRLTPEVLARMDLGDVDETTVVRRTVDFLLRHQDVPDFPVVVELEDVLASYDGYEHALRG